MVRNVRYFIDTVKKAIKKSDGDKSVKQSELARFLDKSFKNS